MFPLSDILQHSDSDYIHYISRKTNFIINQSEVDQLRWFWQHIIKHYDYQGFSRDLSTEERAAFFQLLSSFCYSNPSVQNKQMGEVEKKSMWIFKHPMGGFYIPVEFIKILMNEKSLLKENFLFSLLFRLRLKEQKALTALIKSNYDVSQVVTSEQNAWDMALVLYMLFANFHTTGIYQRTTAYLPALSEKQSARSFQRNVSQQPLLYEPQPIWEYLYSEFSYLHPAIDGWQSMMKHGHKGFYRSLALGVQPKEELVHLFSSGYFLPIFPKDMKKIDDIQLVTPTEIIHGQNDLLARNKVMNLQ